jgi:hypothetical protein
MTRPAFRPAFYPAFRPAFNKLKSIAAAVRSVYNFDGIDDRGQLAFRAINPDGDIDIEWRSGPEVNFSTSRTIISQTLTTVAANQEFFMFVATNGNLAVRVCGIERGTNPAIVYQPNTKYRWRLQGSIVNFWINDVLQPAMSFNRGTAREVTATTQVGSTANTFFYRGQLFDLRINGVLYPIADRNQLIQLPSPSGLGLELITQNVLENPFSKGSQWTYLGSGRWQYVGDGSFNEMIFIANNVQPENGFLEFEVESISGNMRCYTTVSGVGTLQSNPRFNSVGLFRHYYNSKASLGGNSNFFSFFRDGTGMVSSCILKNISFKPLGTCNPINLVNTTPDRWEEVPL